MGELDLKISKSSPLIKTVKSFMSRTSRACISREMKFPGSFSANFEIQNQHQTHHF